MDERITSTLESDIKHFDSARVTRLREVMKRHVDSGAVPGLVMLVHHRGREHAEAMGTMAYTSKESIQRNTIFRLASMTKPITAVGAMILIEECRVRLDDPVDEWLPELKDRRVLRTIDSPLDDTIPAKRPITLRDLLTFRSGYGEVEFISPSCPLVKAMMEAKLPLFAFPFAHSSEEFMKRLGNLPLAFQPGERWLYHKSCEILGVLIARVSGKALGAFLRERIFEPLGMNDTGFYVPEAKLDRLPICHGADMVTGKLVVLDEARGGWASRPPTFENGAGGLVSTVDDMVAFGRMMLNRDQRPWVHLRRPGVGARGPLRWGWRSAGGTRRAGGVGTAVSATPGTHPVRALRPCLRCVGGSRSEAPGYQCQSRARMTARLRTRGVMRHERHSFT
jgi:CubicO group peptidase (beta-lactamase class C family)